MIADQKPEKPLTTKYTKTKIDDFSAHMPSLRKTGQRLSTF
jgi:hypothetical protein